MSSLKFGTSGLRGLVTDMNADVCARYVLAFLDHLEATGALSSGNPVLVGRDLRDSSPTIAAACLSAIERGGYSALDCGELPTPALALEAMKISAPAIMVTGSHIPADRNGLKFYRPDGEITKVDEAGILDHFNRESADRSTDASKLPASAPALDNYRSRYASLGDRFSLAGMRVGVYQHSSVARDLIVDVLESLGAEPVALGRSDVFVPVDTEALRTEDVALARRWAAEQRLDAIVSTDGDADRPLLADELGRFVRGDVVGLLTAAAVGADTVVTPVTSSSAVEQSNLFRDVVRTRVGSPYVIEAMAARAAQGPGVVVGFEANGGVLLGSHVRQDGFDLAALPTRDALLPILSILALARMKGRTVSQLVAELPARFTASDRLENVASAKSAALLAMLSDEPAIGAFLGSRAKLAKVDRTDGVRMELENGDTLHYRASGNAPELRCYAESSTVEQAADLLEWGLGKAEAVIASLNHG